MAEHHAPGILLLQGCAVLGCRQVMPCTPISFVRIILEGHSSHLPLCMQECQPQYELLLRPLSEDKWRFRWGCLHYTTDCF